MPFISSSEDPPPDMPDITQEKPYKVRIKSGVWKAMSEQEMEKFKNKEDAEVAVVLVILLAIGAICFLYYLFYG